MPIYLVLFLTVLFSACGNQNETAPHTEVVSVSTKEDSKLVMPSGVRCIFEDSKGNLWFGSHQEGLAIYNGSTFRYFNMDDGLSDNQIRSIQEDDKGTIWIGTANGICTFKDNRFVNRSSSYEQSFIGDTVWELSENDLWFNAGRKSGVYRYNGQLLTYLAFPVSENDNRFDPYIVTGISRGQNNIWFATYNAVFGYDGTTLEMTDNASLGLNKEMGYLHVRSILEDSKGNVWIGNNGIGVLLKSGKEVINFSEKQGLMHTNSARSGGKSPAGTLEHVFVIKEDNQGNIWFGDRDTGAWKYDGKTMTHYAVGTNLNSQHIWDFQQLKNGDFLAATAAGVVYKFANNQFIPVYH